MILMGDEPGREMNICPCLNGPANGGVYISGAIDG